MRDLNSTAISKYVTMNRRNMSGKLKKVVMLMRLTNSLFYKLIRETGSLWEINKVVSSANKIVSS